MSYDVIYSNQGNLVCADAEVGSNIGPEVGYNPSSPQRMCSLIWTKEEAGGKALPSGYRCRPTASIAADLDSCLGGLCSTSAGDACSSVGALARRARAHAYAREACRAARVLRLDACAGVLPRAQASEGSLERTWDASEWAARKRFASPSSERRGTGWKGAVSRLRCGRPRARSCTSREARHAEAGQAA